jgi:hypothetical protein
LERQDRGKKSEVLDSSDIAVDSAQPEPKGGSRAARRFGYIVAIAVNGALLIVAHNLLSWGWPSFLTDEFADLLPLINLSLGATILVNATYINYDPVWFKSSTQIGLGAITMMLAVRTLQVFPFDFTGYDFDWEPIARGMIILSMIGIGIGLVVETVRLVAVNIRSEQ